MREIEKGCRRKVGFALNFNFLDNGQVLCIFDVLQKLFVVSFKVKYNSQIC